MPRVHERRRKGARCWRRQYSIASRTTLLPRWFACIRFFDTSSTDPYEYTHATASASAEELAVPTLVVLDSGRTASDELFTIVVMCDVLADAAAAIVSDFINIDSSEVHTDSWSVTDRTVAV